RSAADFAGLADFHHLRHFHLHRFVLYGTRAWRRPIAVVETFHSDHLRNPGRSDYPRVRQGFYVGRFAARPRSGDLVARRRGVAQYSFGLCGRQLQRFLAGDDAADPDGDRVWRQHIWTWRADGCSRGIRFRLGGVRLSRHGAGYDRGRFLWAGDRQCAVGFRAVADRANSGNPRGDQARLRLRPELRNRQGSSGGKRRGRQYVQGERETGVDRDSGGGRDDDDFLDYRGADGRTEDRAVVELVHSSPAISAWTNRGRSGDLLVHGRFDAGRDNRRVSGGGVHQGQYQTGRHDQGVGRGQQKSGRNLHKIRAKRHVKYLFDGVFRHFVVRFLRVLLLHR